MATTNVFRNLDKVMLDVKGKPILETEFVPGDPRALPQPIPDSIKRLDTPLYCNTVLANLLATAGDGDPSNKMANAVKMRRWGVGIRIGQGGTFELTQEELEDCKKVLEQYGSIVQVGNISPLLEQDVKKPAK